MTSYEDEEYEVPLRDQRYFGAGIKRKRVPFVSSSDGSLATHAQSREPTTGEAASNAYLSIVLKRNNSKFQKIQAPSDVVATQDAQPPVCEICKLPVAGDESSQRHAASIAHQICLPHNYPPSALDRQRKGLNILQTHGWDPDQRQGLGVTGEGILHPVRAQEKPDRLGLGHGMEESSRKKAKRVRPAKPQAQRLDAGKMKQLDLETRRKDKQLRDVFYRSDDVEKYLGNS